MKTKLAFLIATLLLNSHLHAAITLPSMFSDHMVLQRDTPVVIWGGAKPNQTVTVSIAGQEASTGADGKGAWRIELKPMTASKEPGTLSIQVGDEQKVYKDILIGDVWIGSGQSNMAGRVASYAKNDETLAALAKRESFPRIRLMLGGPKPSWTEATQATVGRFSALHFAFGERLHRELDVPIGLIVGAVGGTPSGSWIPPQTYANSQKCKTAVAQFSKTYDADAARKQYAGKLAAWEKRVQAAKAKGEKPRGRKPSPPKAPGESIRGGKIGGLYERFIQSVEGYRIRGVLWDQGEARSGVLGVDQHTMMSELIRGWREAFGQGDFPFLFVQKPSGGGCAFSNEDPVTRNGDPFVSTLPDISRIGSGEQRFLYFRLMRDNPNSWMVPASDLGSGIHPANKWGYGNRAAQIALSQVYKTGLGYGPTYRTHSVKGNKVRVEFDHVGKGLALAHSEELHGFAVSGDNKQWFWAKAKIEGDVVVVWSDQVEQPTHIRYAFAQKRAWANLFNKNGLPALAFEAGK